MDPDGREHRSLQEPLPLQQRASGGILTEQSCFPSPKPDQPTTCRTATGSVHTGTVVFIGAAAHVSQAGCKLVISAAAVHSDAVVFGDAALAIGTHDFFHATPTTTEHDADWVLAVSSVGARSRAFLQLVSTVSNRDAVAVFAARAVVLGACAHFVSDAILRRNAVVFVHTAGDSFWADAVLCCSTIGLCDAIVVYADGLDDASVHAASATRICSPATAHL
jgi:hypothetical protein